MYIGRFAPSPSGPLHLGSLFTALASYLDAKHYGGRWLVRIEDLDPPREIAGATQSIITTLERFGLITDEPILLQSQRHDLYEKHLNYLHTRQLTYACRCTRKVLLPHKGIHPFAHCPKPSPAEGPSSIRVQTPEEEITLIDLCQNHYSCNLRQSAGDFILKRKDQLYAYHLAVTVDDHLQNITHIVRGNDLLDSTPQQLYLQRLLRFNRPHYLHLPVITHPDGSKLSKQTFAESVEALPVVHTLFQLLKALGQQPPQELISGHQHELLSWASDHWSRAHIPKRSAIPITEIPITPPLTP